MPFIERNDSGAVIGLFSRPQHKGQAFLDDSDPEVVAFRVVPPPPPAPLNAEELYDILKTKGVLVDGDRPRPQPARTP